MRILVCGGRDYSDKAALERALDKLARAQVIDCIIEGNSRGADRLAGYWARKRGILNLKFDADWTAHGNAAGPIRNQQMLDEGRPDGVAAFPGGTGTADMVRRAEAAGLKVWFPCGPPK